MCQRRQDSIITVRLRSGMLSNPGGIISIRPALTQKTFQCILNIIMHQITHPNSEGFVNEY